MLVARKYRSAGTAERVAEYCEAVEALEYGENDTRRARAADKVHGVPLVKLPERDVEDQVFSGQFDEPVVREHGADLVDREVREQHRVRRRRRLGARRRIASGGGG